MMAARQVTAYLDRHRIGALFEDLMAKVIKDTPEEPIAYLIKVLKKMCPDGQPTKYDVPRSSLPPSGSTKFTRSMGLNGTPISQHLVDEGQSVLAKSWAGPDSHNQGSKYRLSGSSKAGRDYPRPWLSGCKPTGKSVEGKDNLRPQARTAHSQSTNERPPWNGKTVVPTHDFDEWFNMQHKQTKATNENSQQFQGTQSRGRNGEKEVPVERPAIYNRQGSSASHGIDHDDNLEEELYEGKDFREEGKSMSSVISHESVYRSRKQNARHAAEEHRRQLRSLLLSKRPTDAGVNGFNKTDDLQDDGTELLENEDELEYEGVSNLNRIGTKLSKSNRQGSSTADSVRVSICARCAKIISGQPSENKSEVGSVYSTSEVDDNFESVSQVGSVTGLNRPTLWPSGFDSESDSSPRKGQHMLQSTNRTLVKGKHMFRGSSLTDGYRDSSRPPSASSSRTDLVYSNKQQRSWNFDGYSSENDTEVSYDQATPPEFGESRPWQRNQLESGSEIDWEPKPGRRVPGRQGFRFNGGEESDSS